MERGAGKKMMIPTLAAEEEGRGHRGAVSLQFDAVVDILSRLPVKSLVRFRSVCKPWCSLTYDPYFIKKHHRMAASTSSTFFTSVGPLAFFDFGGGRIAEYTPPPPPKDLPLRHRLSNALDGLVCGFGDDDTIFLRNVSTSEVALLPPPAKATHALSVGLGFDASTGTYKLLRIFRPEGPTDPINFLCEALTVSANQEWRNLGQPPPLSIYRELFYSDGFIHWIDRSNHLTGAVERYDCKSGTPVVVVAFNCKDETFSTIPIPEFACFQQAELVTFKDRLCFAGIHSSCLNIHMLEDYARSVWTTLYVIDCAGLSGILTDLRIVGIKNGKVLLFDSWNSKDSFAVYFYDLRSKAWSKMTCRNMPLCLGLYTESLVSPRRLLNPRGE